MAINANFNTEYKITLISQQLFTMIHIKDAFKEEQELTVSIIINHQDVITMDSITQKMIPVFALKIIQDKDVTKRGSQKGAMIMVNGFVMSIINLNVSVIKTHTENIVNTQDVKEEESLSKVAFVNVK